MFFLCVAICCRKVHADAAYQKYMSCLLPTTLFPHLLYVTALFLHKLGVVHIVSFFNTVLNFFVNERTTSFLTWTLLMVTSHSLANRIQTSARSNKALSMISVLHSCGLETFHFRLSSDSVKVQTYHVCKIFRLVLARFNFADFRN